MKKEIIINIWGPVAPTGAAATVASDRTQCLGSNVKHIQLPVTLSHQLIQLETICGNVEQHLATSLIECHRTADQARPPWHHPWPGRVTRPSGSPKQVGQVVGLKVRPLVPGH